MVKPPRDRALLAAFFLSGCAALGYELLWTELLGLSLGHETLGVLAVLAGFFGGMACGSAWLHRRARASADPIGLFIRLELIAAGYALVSPYPLHGLAEVIPNALGPAASDNAGPVSLALGIGVAAFSLLPGTFCIGGTLAALVEARRRALPDQTQGRSVGELYAVNTAGATLGVLATVHVLLPTCGIAATAAILAAIGAGAAALARRAPTRTATAQHDRDDVHVVDTSGDPDADVARERWLLLALLLVTGALGVALEVVGVHVLSQLLENTVYTFADILAVFLVGTAVGAAAYTRYLAHRGRPATLAAAFLVAAAVTSIGATVALANAGTVLDAVAPPGSGYATHLVAEGVVAMLVFGPPTIVMGALFSHLVGLLAPAGVGRAYALNTLGAALAPLAFGLWIIPALGYRDSLLVVAYGYLAAFAAFTWFRRFTVRAQLVPIVGVVLLTSVAPPSLVLVRPDDDWTVLEERETAMGLIIVSELNRASNQALRRLQVGRHFRMGGALAFGERRMGNIPLLLHPGAERALYLGVGTGATLSAVTHVPLEHVDAVELIGEVLEMLHYFDGINATVRTAPNVEFHAADARRFVAATQEPYDVIVADLFHPARDGAGGLYALEHFERIRDHLNPGGVFAQWLPLYQLDAPTLQMIVRTFLAAFADAHAFLGVYNVQTPAIALVATVPDATGTGLRIDLETLRNRLEDPAYAELLMQDPRDLFAAYLLDRAGLEAFAGEGRVNSDFWPLVGLRAPVIAYTDEPERGIENLRALMAFARWTPADLIGAENPAAHQTFVAEVESFRSALAFYLEAEALRTTASERTSPPPQALDLYLEAYATAPEFAPARGMLLGSASTSGDVAERVLPKMLEVTPNEPRVVQTYLAYLRRIGDVARYQELAARVRLAPDDSIRDPSSTSR